MLDEFYKNNCYNEYAKFTFNIKKHYFIDNVKARKEVYYGI